MAYGEVRIDPAVAQGGLDSWTAAGQQLSSQVSQAVAAIEAAHQANPWGGDSAGDAFRDNYLGNAGTVADGMSDVPTRLVELGANAEQAIRASLESDATQAGQVTVEVDSGL